MLKHRVTQLVLEPPRVRSLEQEVGVIKNTIDGLKTDMASVRDELHQVNQRLGNTAAAKDVREIDHRVIKIMAYGTVGLVFLDVTSALSLFG